MLRAFGLLAKLKGLRGTAFDVFGYTEERKLERQLIADYFALVDELSAGLNPGNHELAVQLAGIPEDIRGYGHIKLRSLKAARAKWAKRSEEHTSELPSLMRISYAVFCLKK